MNVGYFLSHRLIMIYREDSQNMFFLCYQDIIHSSRFLRDAEYGEEGLR